MTRAKKIIIRLVPFVFIVIIIGIIWFGMYSVGKWVETLPGNKINRLDRIEKKLDILLDNRPLEPILQ